MVDEQISLVTQQRVTNWQQVLLSIQHFVAMFGATVLVPLLTGLDPLVALFTAGIGTLLFHLITGGSVPVFLGSSFAFIAPVIMVKEQFGSLDYATGGIVVAGLCYLGFSLVVRFAGVRVIKRMFPPVVTGPMIIVIGLTLSPVAVDMASGNWLVAVLVVITVVITSSVLKGFWNLIPVLTGVVVGYVCFAIFGHVDISPVKEASWFSVPNFMFPKFDWAAIATIAPVSVATFMEHIGDITTNGAVVGKNFFEKPGLHRTLIGDGLATAVAGMLGGPANTTYSENTGVLALTKVYEPKVLRGAAALAIMVAFLSKFGAILRTIPTPVIGGISLVLFGMIASVGVRTLVNARVDFSRSKNLLVASLILTVGIGGASLQVGNIEFKGLSLAAIVGIIANLLIPEKRN